MLGLGAGKNRIDSLQDQRTEDQRHHQQRHRRRRADQHQRGGAQPQNVAKQEGFKVHRRSSDRQQKDTPRL